jgi:Raf kinase inhibitor-like YbhB/YbcL family protein
MLKCGVIIVVATLVSACNRQAGPVANTNINKPAAPAIITINSAAFQNGGSIPAKYTCDGQNVSPPLEWSGVPPAAKSLALVCEDPDAPGKTWIHWVVYDLPATISQLPEGITQGDTLNDGAKQGRNDFGKTGYGGPCPPSGTHRYFFKLYALDTPASLPPLATQAQLTKAMEGHVLAHGELMGRYSR